MRIPGTCPGYASSFSAHSCLRTETPAQAEAVDPSIRRRCRPVPSSGAFGWVVVQRPRVGWYVSPRAQEEKDQTD